MDYTSQCEERFLYAPSGTCTCTFLQSVSIQPIGLGWLHGLLSRNTFLGESSPVCTGVPGWIACTVQLLHELCESDSGTACESVTEEVSV